LRLHCPLSLPAWGSISCTVLGHLLAPASASIRAVGPSIAISARARKIDGYRSLRGGPTRVSWASRKRNRHRAPGGPATGQMSRREVGSVRRTRPVTIPGPGRQTGRAASWTPVPDDIVCAPSQLRFCLAKRNGRIRGGKWIPGPGCGLSCLWCSCKRNHNPQVTKPIILQAPNRDANSTKLIRPGQGPFSGLQNAPDSDRFTLLI